MQLAHLGRAQLAAVAVEGAPLVVLERQLLFQLHLHLVAVTLGTATAGGTVGLTRVHQLVSQLV